MSRHNIGSSVLPVEFTVVAVKRVIALQILEAMKRQELTKVAMAERMGTSRMALNRLLDPENPSVTLQTLQSAARALGGRLKVELELVRDD